MDEWLDDDGAAGGIEDDCDADSDEEGVVVGELEELGICPWCPESPVLPEEYGGPSLCAHYLGHEEDGERAWVPWPVPSACLSPRWEERAEALFPVADDAGGWPCFASHPLLNRAFGTDLLPLLNAWAYRGLCAPPRPDAAGTLRALLAVDVGTGAVVTSTYRSDGFLTSTSGTVYYAADARAVREKLAVSCDALAAGFFRLERLLAAEAEAGAGASNAAAKEGSDGRS